MTEHNKNEKGTNMTQQEILEIIVKALDSKRAEDIQVLRVHDLTILGDYFIIANGTSTTHTRTLADEVEYQLSEKGIEPLHREGRGNGSNWVVLDYADIIVHVFCKDTREFYQLERLWADGEPVDISQWTKPNGIA
jgi:ribosome-associated protein